MREAAFERIADQIIFVGARECLDQKLALPRQLRAPLLNLQPFTHLRRQRTPLLRMGDDAADPRGKIRREREFAAL
ncbi:MAG TPA: hypothetical protein VME41_04760, partial [Stellaceae bacterium]|nr:hypothetical protein [Stellaceae bacterium]